MIGLLDLLIYLDESLTKNLNSLVINGYIERRTSRWIEDRTISGSIHFQDKEQFYEEDRCIKDERDGYKGKNTTSADTFSDSVENGKSIDGRRVVRREEELTRIYTTFEIHQQLIKGLNDGNILKSTSSDWLNEDINVGDYIEISGVISSDSVTSYIDTYSNLINSIGTSKLSTLSSKLENNILSYDMVQNQLTYLKDLLNNNNTQDVIVKTNSNDIVITINNQYFINSYGNIYEKADCPCKIIGKVIKVAEENDCIHLLRKSGQSQFYEQLFCYCEPLKQCLSDSGVCVPNQPLLKIKGKSLLIIPISVCI